MGNTLFASKSTEIKQKIIKTPEQIESERKNREQKKKKVKG
jgi:hypothetical protein